MSSIEEDRQVRQQLESRFKQGNTVSVKAESGRDSSRKRAARRSNLLMTACAISGLAGLVLADGAFVAYLYNQFALPNQPTAAASALAASFPMVPVKEHHVRSTTPVPGLSAS